MGMTFMEKPIERTENQEYTNKFKTKTYFIERPNVAYDGKWGIAMDVGYSATKIFSPNMVASFPSFVQKVAIGTVDSAFGGLPKSSIAYRDETGEYLVGEAAQNQISANDTTSVAASAYIRNRYFSQDFLVCSRVGMALGMQNNQYGYVGDNEVYLQTGLPPEYMSDAPDLIEALTGLHQFSVKIGNGAWVDYEVVLPEQNIGVMPQPMGTLISIATNKDGSSHKNAKDYFTKNLIIFDAGFGTLDVFYLKNHFLDRAKCKTWDNYGMLRVMQESAVILKDRYEKEIPIPALQKVLEDGLFKGKFDRKTRTAEKIQFAPILKEANEKVAKEALNKLDELYNFLLDEDYLVVTGGTGAAWYPFIKEYYENIEGLTILSGSQGDDLPEVFANVRGYYFKQLNGFKSIK